MEVNCDARAWRRWLLLAALLLAALLPAFWLEIAMPPRAGTALLWGVSLSASKYGIPLVALVMLLALRLPLRRLPPLVLPLLLLLGGGAWLNEHVTKPWLGEARPNVAWLASASTGPVLAEGATAFYALPDKASRSRRLEQALAASSLELPPLLRGHWVAETGFSFPSGHAFAASLLGSWFLFWLLCLERRRWLVAAVLLWMVAVDWSRLLLGVHRAEDVLAGALQGLVLAVAAIAVSRWWQGRVR